MKTTNRLGLDIKSTKSIADQMNLLLANYQIFYMNARAYHWNIKGEKFFELHLKFEELYNDALLKVDAIAERILTLGHIPNHTFSDYLALSQIQESQNVSEGSKAIEEIVFGFEIILVIERKILKLSQEINDEGTSALMSDYIREQEKLIWMYLAYLA